MNTFAMTRQHFEEILNFVAPTMYHWWTTLYSFGSKFASFNENMPEVTSGIHS